MLLSTKNYKTFCIETEDGEVIKEFSGAVNTGKALPGDVVEPTETGCQLVSRVQHPPLSGLLEFNTKIRYGFTSRDVPLYLFRPYNEAYPPMLVSSKEITRENQIAVVLFEHWEDQTFPRGGLVHIMGAAGDRDVEKTAVALQHSPWSWSKKMIPDTLVYPPKEGRHILDKPTINIDPRGCHDIDDVVSLWEEGGVWTLAISIADVAAFAALNPALLFAEKIGQTLYTSAGKALRPMFPPKFSEDIFSLLPGEERFVLSLFAKWDGTALYDIQWKECIVRNWASYTYENCRESTEVNMGVLSSIVNSLGEETDDTHKWVEYLMLFYNSEAAAVLKRAGAGLLRIHGEPEKELLARLESLQLPAKELAYPAAVYATTDAVGGHWGLRKDAYCHASSPIRRYADVLNQEVLKAALRGGQGTDISYKRYALALNRLDKSAKAYERDCRFVDCILGAPGIPVHGVVAEVLTGKNKVSIYCYDWKRMIRCKTGTVLTMGDQVMIGFYANMTTASWKNRIVYRVERI
jgi:exoribonuclease R